MMQVFNWREFIKKNKIDTAFINDIISRLPLLSSDAYIAGGAICDTLMGEKPKDIDIFFTTEEAQKKFKNELISEESITASGITDAGRTIAGKYHVLFYDKQLLLDAKTRTSIQLVGQDDDSRYGYQSIQERVANADFTVTQFVYDGINLYCGDTSIIDLKTRILAPNNISSLDFGKRVNRYKEKGFLMNPEIALIEYQNAISESKKMRKEQLAVINKIKGSNNK